jgi:hypothetical protein
VTSDNWPALRDSLRDALAADPAIAAMGIEKVRAAELRLLCPKGGHFIANVAVIVLDDHMILLRPRGKDKQHFGDTFNDPNHGFRFDMRVDGWRPLPDGSGGYRDRAGVGDLKQDVRMHCMNRKCGYNGSFDYNLLSADLVREAMAGHADYRLTN